MAVEELIDCFVNDGAGGALVICRIAALEFSLVQGVEDRRLDFALVSITGSLEQLDDVMRYVRDCQIIPFTACQPDDFFGLRRLCVWASGGPSSPFGKGWLVQQALAGLNLDCISP
jgi:hypothetical protein